MGTFLFSWGFDKFRFPFEHCLTNDAGFQSLSEGSSSASFWGAEHEANNCLEEVTHQLHQRQQLSPEHLLLAHPGNPTRPQMRKPSVDNWITERPGSNGHRFNSLRAATIHESSLSASPDDSLVIENDSLKNDERGDDEPTMAQDSLQFPNQQKPPPIPSVNFQQPDSLSDAFVRNNGDFFDSMEEAVSVTDNAPVSGKKKLIIPYATDSYSSNKSLSTSQEDDDDDEDEEDDEEEEEDEDDEDVDEMSAVVKDVHIELARPPPTSTSRRPVSASPALAGGAPVSGHRLLPNPPNNLRRQSSGSNPDLRHGLCPNLNGPFPAKRLPADHPTAAPAVATTAPVVVSAQQQQSLMRMATERMKRKFLGGWT